MSRLEASRTVRCAHSRIDALLLLPSVGQRLEEFDPCEVRRILVGHHVSVLDSGISIKGAWR